MYQLKNLGTGLAYIFPFKEKCFSSDRQKNKEEEKIMTAEQMSATVRANAIKAEMIRMVEKV
jgi:hypothetical protein